MTNFEKITASPEALGQFLAELPVATGPWDIVPHSGGIYKRETKRGGAFRPCMES